MMTNREIATAWRVIEEMISLGWTFEASCIAEEWVVRFGHYMSKSSSFVEAVFAAEAKAKNPPDTYTYSRRGQEPAE